MKEIKHYDRGPYYFQRYTPDELLRMQSRGKFLTRQEKEIAKKYAISKRKEKQMKKYASKMTAVSKNW